MKQRLLAIFSSSIISDLIQKAFGLVNSILILNFLGASVAGQYFLLLAAFSAVPALLNPLDQVLARFLPVVASVQRTLLAVGALITKLYGCVVAICFFVAINLWFPELYRRFFGGNTPSLMGYAAFCFGLMPLISSWCSRVLASYRDYKLQITIDIVQAILVTLWFVVALWGFDIDSVENVLPGFAIISFVTSMVKLRRIAVHDHSWARSFFKSSVAPAGAIDELFASRYRQYLFPFFLTSMSGFLKEYFPVLAVGAIAETHAVAHFRVIQQIFRVAHSVVPNAFEVVRPSLVTVQSASVDSKGFSKKYQYYALGYIATASMFGIVVLLALEPILSIWSVDRSALLYAIAGIFALELLFGSAAHVEYQIFLLQEKIGYMVVMSVVRQIITAVVMVVAGAYFGQIGVALGAAAGACYAWLGFILYSRSRKLRPTIYIRHTILWVSLLIAVMTLVAALQFVAIWE